MFRISGLILSLVQLIANSRAQGTDFNFDFNELKKLLRKIYILENADKYDTFTTSVFIPNYGDPTNVDYQLVDGGIPIAIAPNSQFSASTANFNSGIN